MPCIPNAVSLKKIYTPTPCSLSILIFCLDRRETKHLGIGNFSIEISPAKFDPTVLKSLKAGIIPG